MLGVASAQTVHFAKARFVYIKHSFLEVRVHSSDSVDLKTTCVCCPAALPIPSPPQPHARQNLPRAATWRPETEPLGLGDGPKAGDEQLPARRTTWLKRHYRNKWEVTIYIYIYTHIYIIYI